MNLFYAEPADIRPPHIQIKGQEAKHISKVMRYGAGDQIMVTDGSGKKYECQIEGITRSELDLKILNSTTGERAKPFLTVCIGNIKKRDRLEFAIEKMTELGVDRIIVFKGEHSQKENVRTDRLEAAALAAMKQSLRCYLPEVFVENSLERAMELHLGQAKLLFADETAGVEGIHGSRTSGFEPLFVVIGPEGGFSSKERELLQRSSAGAFSLGPNRLRTETAAIVVVDRFKGAVV